MKTVCKFGLSIAISLLLLHVPTAVGDDPPSGQRTIVIKTVDPDGQPITEVKILRSVWTDQKDFKNNENFVTNAEGAATVTLPESMHILRVWARKKGFAGLFTNWSRTDIGNVPAAVTFVMPPETTVGGTLVNESGGPIADAKIGLRLGGGGEPMNPGLPTRYTLSKSSARTDKQGKWTCGSIPPGDDVKISLKIEHSDYISDEYFGQLQKTNGVTAAALGEKTARIVMTEGHVLGGRILDSEGKPVSGAVVSWADSKAWYVEERIVSSDDDGHYRLPPRPAGKLFVAVAAEGLKPQLIEVELGNHAEPFDFTLQDGNVLRLLVVDVDGNPIPGAVVKIEQWRGVSSMISGTSCKLFEISKPNKAGTDGVFRWESAPDDSVRLRVSKREWSSVEAELSPSEAAQSITLYQSVVISGKVIDDATGMPINRAKIYPVSYYPRRPDDPIVQRTQMREIDDGKYSHDESGWDAGEELMLQFESIGYRPTRIGPFNQSTGKVNIDVRMEKASPLVGRVVGIDGKPVADATVSFATKDSSLLVSDLTYRREGFSRQTDSMGNFKLSATISPPVIIAAHESGYCEVALELNEQPGDLQLQPWARVEGRLTQGGEPVVGESISVRPIRMLGGDNPHVQDSFHKTTDGDGRFVFRRLPPVPSCLSPYLSVWRECQLTSSHHVPLALQGGKTHKVVLGEEGIVVHGKVRPAGDLASSLDMNYCLNYLLKRAPGIAPPEPIGRAGFDWRDGWSFDWRSSQEGLGFLKTLHHHFVKFEPDGTFTIHGVAAGDYDFAIAIYEPPEGCLIDPVGLDVVPFTVSEKDLSAGELDLGEIEVEVSLGPQVGDPFPNFRYRSVKDDEIHSIAELKGRYVLVDFWATWCAPCVKAIPDLRTAVQRYDTDKVAVLSVSLDEQLDQAREFIAGKEMDWPQALLGERDNPLVRRQLGISSVPVYYVLDPEGKLVHRSFRLEEALGALGQESDTVKID